ncbi:ATP-binding cassette domain-containing protein [Bacillus cereus]
MGLLILKEVEKSLGERKILKKVSLEINEGEIYGILGPNGGGKSTLLRVIAGLTSIDEGKIKLAGYSLGKYPSEYKKMSGLVISLSSRQ